MIHPKRLSDILLTACRTVLGGCRIESELTIDRFKMRARFDMINRCFRRNPPVP
jgi:hypothetical protein